ncbi:MAG TPA: ABC transporter ATP-binding protein [Burkholderiales bacterium]|jgi:nitrate/nitrite transport system ATP-binding protein|nr:ABC transporter ATP-binding protein [Burkholderiales bacterium]
MSFLQIQGLARRYGPATVFEGVNFSMERGEFVCIIGHSGCGKTTILNILAGLDVASEGVVVMDNREVAGPSLDRGVVFQGHALMPWLSAMSNIAFAVKSRWPDWNRIQVQTHCQKFLDLVGLTGAEHKKPAQLSGGMKQRVGIARAFAIQPKMLLLDEPFGALDALTRGTIQDELLRICAATHQTVFMITHDVDEAILLADKVLLMSNGPNACIAEAVENTLAKPRDRHSIHHDPQYYRIRNHLVDFLVNRSRLYQSGKAVRPERPPVVRPGSDDAAPPPTPVAKVVNLRH